jgi:hypothetical protein
MAIQAVARSRAALPTAIGLVLLTAVARSYDQTWIGENPFLWLLGPLLFSLVSGTWLFLIVYAGFVRAHWGPDDQWGSVWRDWPTFMGIYWMTAPTGWIYAVPVERFLDDIAAARANITLLAIVSLWRVLLFARIVQVVCVVKYGIALTWVLIAACIEACLVLFVTSFGQAIGRSMGGLRNSPAEDVILNALGFSLVAAFWVGVVAIAVACVWRLRAFSRRLEPRRPDPIPFQPLAAGFTFWTLAALWGQPFVYRNVQAERLVYDQQYREAMDYLAGFAPSDFAPSRPLPPKGYEYDSLLHVAELIARVGDKDPEWLRDHLIRRLDEVVDSVRSRHRRPLEQSPSQEEIAENLQQSYFLHRLQPKAAQGLVDALATQAWLEPWTRSNHGFLKAMGNHATESATTAWQPVLESLAKLGIRPPDSVPESGSLQTTPQQAVDDAPRTP